MTEERVSKIHYWVIRVPGVLACALSALIWTASFFVVLKREADDTTLAWVFGAGVVLLVIPQKATEYVLNHLPGLKRN